MAEWVSHPELPQPRPHTPSRPYIPLPAPMPLRGAWTFASWLRTCPYYKTSGRSASHSHPFALKIPRSMVKRGVVKNDRTPQPNKRRVIKNTHPPPLHFPKPRDLASPAPWAAHRGLRLFQNPRPPKKPPFPILPATAFRVFHTSPPTKRVQPCGCTLSQINAWVTSSPRRRRRWPQPAFLGAGRP